MDEQQEKAYMGYFRKYLGMFRSVVKKFVELRIPLSEVKKWFSYVVTVAEITCFLRNGFVPQHMRTVEELTEER